MKKSQQLNQNTGNAEFFCVTATSDQSVLEPVELTAAELEAVAGGPEVGNGSSNLIADQHRF